MRVVFSVFVVLVELNKRVVDGAADLSAGALGMPAAVCGWVATDVGWVVTDVSSISFS
jgi:hypothetical protein